MNTQEPASGRSTFLSAARQVLEEAGEPLHPRLIAERALTAGLITTRGKTPDATMAAQLYTDIQHRGEQSPFVRVGKALFGLRAWGGAGLPPKKAGPKVTVPRSANVVPLAQDPAERLASEVLTAQYESFNAVHFEEMLTEAFRFLGFRATHVGGAGQTDIVLDAAISASPYRVVVDAKSNKSGKIADANIDWNSLADHRKAEGADHALVVAPGFGGGNLLKRADDYGVALMQAETVAELIRLHRSTPFTLVDLRSLFESPGPVAKAIEQLRQVSQATRARWQLIGDLVALIEQLPAGEYAEAQKLWLLLFFQRKENAPTREAVEDAINILASRAVAVLRSVNGSSEYQLTMHGDTAIRRLRALAQALQVEETPAQVSPAHEVRPPEAPVPFSARRSSLRRASRVSLPTDFHAARTRLLQHLRSLGFDPPEQLSPRLVRLRKAGRSLGLAFRTSKLYPDGKWWWAFSDAADHVPHAGCEAVVLVGLMQDPVDVALARPEVVFVPWGEAVANARDSQTWRETGRIHIYIQPGSQRWSKWVINPAMLALSSIDSLLVGSS